MEVLVFHNIYGDGGLIYTEFYVFVTNAFVSPGLWLIDPWDWQKRILQQKIKKEVKDTNNKCAMTQKEANEFSYKKNLILL